MELMKKMRLTRQMPKEQKKGAIHTLDADVHKLLGPEYKRYRAVQEQVHKEREAAAAAAAAAAGKPPPPPPPLSLMSTTLPKKKGMGLMGGKKKKKLPSVAGRRAAAGLQPRPSCVIMCASLCLWCAPLTVAVPHAPLAGEWRSVRRSPAAGDAHVVRAPPIACCDPRDDSKLCYPADAAPIRAQYSRLSVLLSAQLGPFPVMSCARSDL